MDIYLALYDLSAHELIASETYSGATKEECLDRERMFKEETFLLKPREVSVYSSFEKPFDWALVEPKPAAEPAPDGLKPAEDQVTTKEPAV